MPEGDTLRRAAAQLTEALAGGTLTRTDFRVPALATVELTGRTVTGARAVGKHLFVDVAASAPEAGDAAVIHAHLKMEGRWYTHPAGTRWPFPAHTARVVLRADAPRNRDTEAVGVDLGELNLFTPAQAEARIAHLGPDLLGQPRRGEPYRPGDWNGAEALARLRAEPDRAIGAALLDQRIVAGIGNEYRAELLFLRGIAPARSVADADAAGQLEPLLMLARRAMAANLGRDARVFTGVDRKGQRHWVYGRGGEACRRCHTPLESGELGEISGSELDSDRFARRVCYCPRCQR